MNVQHTYIHASKSSKKLFFWWGMGGGVEGVGFITSDFFVVINNRNDLSEGELAAVLENST